MAGLVDVIFGGGGGNKGGGGGAGNVLGSILGAATGNPLALLGLLGGGGGNGQTNLAPGMMIPGVQPDPRATQQLVQEALRALGVDPAREVAQQQTVSAVQQSVDPALSAIQEQLRMQSLREQATAEHREIVEADQRFADLTQRLDWIASRIGGPAGPQRW